MKDGFSSGIVASPMAGFGGQKIRVVGQLPIVVPRLGQGGSRFGVSFVEQVRVA